MSKITKQPSKKGTAILYPDLIECSKLVRDQFWQQFYKDLACGKASKGIYITNGIIQTASKRKGFSFCITDKSPEIIIKELHKLLVTYTSICSHKDLDKKYQYINEIQKELNEYTHGKWTGIKRKQIRNILIMNYAISLRKTYKLSWPATIAAFQTIMNAFICKTHTSKDVTYSEGKIENIEDLDCQLVEIYNGIDSFIEKRVINLRLTTMEDVIDNDKYNVKLQNL